MRINWALIVLKYFSNQKRIVKITNNCFVYRLFGHVVHRVSQKTTRSFSLWVSERTVPQLKIFQTSGIVLN